MLKMVFIILIIIHALIHVLGFARAFHLAEVRQLTLAIPKTVGLLWLLSAVMFITTAVLLVSNNGRWWMVAAPAVFLSQVLIVLHWQDARVGTVANVIVLAGMIVGYGNWSFNVMVKNELGTFLAGVPHEKRVVTKEMLEDLPTVVRRWLERSNVAGGEFIHSVHLFQRGKMRTSSDGRWMPVEAEQWFRTDEPGFIWVADVRAAPGIHLAGRDSYMHGKGRMLIKLLSLIKVADASGKETDQGAMLRYLAETVWFPSAALSPYIVWEEVDSTSARATIDYGGIKASGLFRFNQDGDVVSFEARRYYDRREGATLENWLIQIDPGSCREFGGVRVPTRAVVTWRLKDGDFTWYRLEVTDIHYNEVKNPG